ncbi:MAG: nitroreductase family protein [Roseiarcus sp.]
MRDISEIIRQRRSTRAPFDPQRRIPEQDLRQILEAARWAPTAHNMQNFEVIVVDDEAALAAIGAIRSQPSPTFLRENYRQLSFSEDELRRRKTGLLASMFPPAWRSPDADAEHAFVGRAMQNCPTLLIVVADARRRAPASEGDALGVMSLGCVMQNIWLAAEALGVAMQVLSAFSAREAEDELRRILDIPDPMKIAFACRLGYLDAAPGGYLRVRREVGDFTHRNRYGKGGIA